MEIRLREQMSDEIGALRGEVQDLKTHMNAQVGRLIMLLEPGVRISRFDHPHKLRAVRCFLGVFGIFLDPLFLGRFLIKFLCPGLI